MVDYTREPRFGHEPPPRRPARPGDRRSSPEPSEHSTIDYFSDMPDLSTGDRTITDPHELLGWLVAEAKWVGEWEHVSAAFMTVVDELLKQVRSAGYLPSLGSEFEAMLAMLFRPRETVRVSQAMVRLVRRLLIEAVCYRHHQELYSLIGRFAEIAGVDDGLSIDVGARKVRITSSRALRRSHRIQVDITFDRKPRS